MPIFFFKMSVIVVDARWNLTEYQISDKCQSSHCFIQSNFNTLKIFKMLLQRCKKLYFSKAEVQTVITSVPD